MSQQHSPILRAAVLDLRSLHNVGAIFRTADGAGFAQLVLAGHTGTPPDPRIAKVALGAELSLPWLHCPTLESLLHELRDDWVVVLEQHPGSQLPGSVTVPLRDAQRTITLVACGELQGAPPELLARADALVELPMRGDKESLNVSVAFGVAAYAIADHVLGADESRLRSRQTPRAPREGVLTRGVTRGQIPDRQR